MIFILFKNRKAIWWNLVSVIVVSVLGPHPLSADPLLGVEAIKEEMVYRTDADQAITLLLSKCVYPAEDRHLDAIIWLADIPGDEAATGTLEVMLESANGEILSSGEINPIPGGRVFFSYSFDSATASGDFVLKVVWREDDGQLLGADEGAFTVMPLSGVATAGRIALTVPNTNGVAGTRVPVTVGVPFPRGAIDDESRLRLVDSDGMEHGLQSKIVARWSRFGSIKWLMCDFTAQLDGRPTELFLEFGPTVQRRQNSPIKVIERPGKPPLVELGSLRFGDGIEVNQTGEKNPIKAVAAEGLVGAFVEHEDGTVYHQPDDVDWLVEDVGPEKVVLLRRGWYRDPGSDAPFCQFVTRFILFKDSNLVTLMNTWIFTGDAYEDRIRNMGWQLALDNLPDGAFLAAGEGEGAVWEEGQYLLQYDFERYLIAGSGSEVLFTGERSPGVAKASSRDTAVVVGVNDFWQNYPAELEFADGALFVHQWPRHGRPAVHPARIDDGLRLWFAHEGELLDFALPVEWTEDPDFYYAAGSREPYQLRHRRETVNAQGIAKTDEIRIWIGAADSAVKGTALIRGLDDASLRAYVAPQWLAASGTFYEIHHRDPETFPEEEHYFELAALAPLKWIERIRFYGKWIWGDMTWLPDLENRGFGLYRGFRKAHQGWPYSWIPYARSGDPRLFVLADAATRHQIDVVFCHYSDERVPGALDDGRGRSRGFYPRYRVPWATHQVNPSTRSYIDKADYLQHGYFLTGNPRILDVYTDWVDLTKNEGWNFRTVGFDSRVNFERPMVSGAEHGSVNLLKSYTETYEALFDPWFLAAAHQIARMHREAHEIDGWHGISNQPGPREFLRFSGCKEYEPFYMAYARKYTATDADFYHYLDTYPMMEPAAFASLRSEDPFFLRRVRAMVDEAIDWAYTYDGEPDYLRGRRVTGGWTHHMAYLLQQFPFALYILAHADSDPLPLPNRIFSIPGDSTAEEFSINGRSAYRYSYDLLLLKEPDSPLELDLYSQQRGIDGFRYELSDPAATVYAVGQVDDEVLNAIRKDAGAHLLPESGSWAVGSVPYSLEVPAEAPAGVWTLRVTGESFRRPVHQVRDVDALRLPVGRPATGEVWFLGEEREIGPTIHNHGGHYWFFVPDGVTSFWIDFIGAGGGRIPTITVRDPDGNKAWNFQAPVDAVGLDEQEPVRAVVDVAPHHAGALWRVTVGGRSGGVRFDPIISPYVALDPGKWFDPNDFSNPQQANPQPDQ